MRGKGRRWTGAAWAALAVAVLASFPAVGQAAAQAKDQFYEYHVTPNVMVPMQDGVRMATDVYRPARNGQPVQGRWPVVLFRIPYNKLQPRYIAQARFFAEHGYVYVAQDVRGRFASEGLYHPFGTELSPDGYDAVVWASKQPWSNGRVATIGISYGGLTQITMGVEDPPGLAAQFVQQIWDKGWENGMYVNGAFHMRRIGWITGQASVSREAAQDPLVRVAIERMNEDLMSWVHRFPHAFRRGASPLALAPNYEEFLSASIENNRFGPYWQRKGGLNTKDFWDSYADVPVLWQGGWYDIMPKQTTEQYVRTVRKNRSPQKLLMGPWTHGRPLSNSGDVEFGMEAVVNFDIIGLRWFDQFLKGVDTGILEDPPISIFVMGGGDGHRTTEGRIFHGGEWRFENEWPLARARNTAFYFHGDGSLRPEPPGSEARPTAYMHDPSNPVPTIGGVDAFAYPKGPGGFDQRDLDGRPLRLRPDVVVFQTPPLERDVEVTGPIMVTLHASSSAIDTDFTVKVLDVYPPSRDWPEGFEMNLSDIILRAAYREPEKDPVPLEPGRVYEFTFEVPPVSNVFKSGHRIRVDIASSNYPRFDVNPGTMDHPWERRRYVTAENRIYHDREHPSHIVLPIIPR